MFDRTSDSNYEMIPQDDPTSDTIPLFG